MPRTGPEEQQYFAQGNNKLLKVTYDLSLPWFPDSDTVSPQGSSLVGASTSALIEPLTWMILLILLDWKHPQ